MIITQPPLAPAGEGVSSYQNGLNLLVLWRVYTSRDRKGAEKFRSIWSQ
jgi:hypothetical protein